MSRRDNLVEVLTTLIKGQHSGINPVLLPQGQYAKGINISSRKGLAKSRPQFKFLTELQSGKFQGAFAYTMNSTDRIVYGSGGDVYSYDVDSNSSVQYGSLSPLVNQLYFCKVDRYVVIQDGLSTPVIGEEENRYTGNQSIPIGTIMAYGHGRLFVSPKFVRDLYGNITGETGRPYFMAGDIIRVDDPSIALRFTETNYLNEGRGFSLPNELGFIYGMAFMRNASSGTGLGSFIVFAREGISAFAVNMPRAQWKDIDFSQVLFTTNGTISPNSIINVNSDLIYRSPLGITTLKYSMELAASTMVNTTYSGEVLDTLELDTYEDLPFVSAVASNNRVLMTSGGRYNSGGFKCLISLDLNNVSSITAPEAVPSYDGIWTGFEFLQIMKCRYNNKETIFTIVKRDNKNELWYLDEDNYSTTIQSNNAIDIISSRIDTRSFSMNSIDLTKNFFAADLWAKEMRGEINITLYWRADGYTLWNQCNTITIQAADSGQQQSRYRLRFAPQSNTYDPTTDRITTAGTVFQFCIKWTGKMTIERIEFFAIGVAEQPNLGIASEEITLLEEGNNGIIIDDFEYLIE